MLNKAILVGRLCTDPELKQTTSGVPVCTFRLAVRRAYTSRGGEPQTDFLNVVAWRQQAEFVSNYFKKGNMIGIDGHIESRSYVDQNTQQNRTVVEIIAERLSFIESKASAAASSGGGDYSGGGSFTGNAAPVYNAPQPAPAAPAGGGQQSSSSFSNGDFGDFQEIDSDEDLPF